MCVPDNPELISLQSNSKGYKIEVNTLNDTYHVNLKRARGKLKHKKTSGFLSSTFGIYITSYFLNVESILSKGIHVGTFERDGRGSLVYKKWIPSKEELKSANNVYIDEQTNTALRVSRETLSKKLQLVWHLFQIKASIKLN